MKIYDENTPFSIWADKWFQHKSIGISEGYKVAIRCQTNYLINYFSDTPINEIRPMDINEFIEQLAIRNPKTNKPSSKQLLKDIKCVASNIFDFVSDNTNYDRNPAKRVKIPKNAPKSTRRALSYDEINWIIKLSHRARLAALIMCFCGLRAGELIPLTWSDIDFDHSIITVNKSVQKVASNVYSVKTGTKNGRNRNVPIPKWLIEEIRYYMNTSNSRFVCCKSNEDIHTPSSWTRLWESYNNQLSHAFATSNQAKHSLYSPKGIKIRVEKITPHMLRHTYATLLYTSGVDVLSASKLLGHSDVAVTLKTYTHLNEEKYVVSIENFDEYINNRFFKK